MNSLVQIILSALVIYYFGYIWGAIVFITLYYFFSDKSVDNVISSLKVESPKEFIQRHFYYGLNQFTEDELIELCRKNGLGFSNKDKSQLVDTMVQYFIINNSKRVAITKTQINMFTDKSLRIICRSIGLTYSGKLKEDLVNELYNIFLYVDSWNYTDQDLKYINLEDFNIEYLKSFIRKRGGKVSGNKAELIMNLKNLIK